MLQVIVVSEGHSSGQLQDLLGMTSEAASLGMDCPLGWKEREEFRWGGWVTVTVTYNEQKSNEKNIAVATLFYLYDRGYSPNSDWLLGKRMRKT